MPNRMTQKEAERLLNITAPYTMGDLKKTHRRHMATYHPDRFHGDGTDGSMTKDEAEGIFISGNQAYDVLKDLFRNQPDDYIVTPECQRPSSATGRTSDPHAHAKATKDDATGNAASSGFACDDLRDATNDSHTYGRPKGYDPWSGYPGHGSSNGNGTRFSHKTTGGAGTRRSTGKSRSNKRGAAAGRGVAATADTTRHTQAADPYAPSPESRKFLWPWLVLTTTAIWFAFWSKSEPQEAFEFAVGVLFNPVKLSVFLGIAFIPCCIRLANCRLHEKILR